jgi:formamidopyrimidine-DNA glycosylase
VPNEFAHLGVDVFDTLFTPQYLMSEVTKLEYTHNDKCIKSFLMSPAVIAWLDNEMASEALFLSGINPYLSVEASISYGNTVMLVKSLKTLYQRAMEVVRNDLCSMNVASIDALYSVYGREGAECLMCGNDILRGIIDGKSTYWCPHCQTNNKKDVAHV